MKWPLVSRRFYEYERDFFEEMAAQNRKIYDSIMAQNQEFLDLYIAAIAERDRYRAEANMMKGRMAGAGDEGHKLFGPYFETMMTRANDLS